MPATHRFHPYEVQLVAFALALLPVIAAMVLVACGRFVQRRGRGQAGKAFDSGLEAVVRS